MRNDRVAYQFLMDILVPLRARQPINNKLSSPHVPSFLSGTVHMKQVGGKGTFRYLNLKMCRKIRNRLCCMRDTTNLRRPGGCFLYDISRLRGGACALPLIERSTPQITWIKKVMDRSGERARLPNRRRRRWLYVSNQGPEMGQTKSERQLA